MTTQTDIVEGYAELPLGCVVPTPDNNRHINPDSPDIGELAESIRLRGVLQPVVCRPYPERPGYYDLRAGARRWHASVKAGKFTIPAMVRRMTDEEALEVTVVENMQREDLTPIEEAEGVQRLLDSGQSAEEVSRAIGHTRQWVLCRARLMHLSAMWRRAIEPIEGEDPVCANADIADWGVALLEEVAKLPPATQDALLQDRVGKSWFGRPGLDELRTQIGYITCSLKTAPFDVTDTTLLKKAPSCVNCLDRRGAQPDLFGVQEVVPTEEDTCLLPDCYNRKIEAYRERELQRVRKALPDAIEVEQSRLGCHDEQGEYIKVAYVHGRDTYVDCMPDAPGAQDAIVVGTDHPGSICVRPIRRQESNEETWTVGEARSELEQNRQTEAKAEIVRQLETIPTPQILARGQLDAAKLLRLLVCGMGAGQDRSDRDRTLGADWLTRDSDDDVLCNAYDYIQDHLVGISGRGRRWGEKRWSQQACRALCDILRVDWEACVTAGIAAHPEPEEWAGLNDDAPVPEEE